MIRPFKEEDIEKARAIHEKYFKEEFDFPNFLQNFICAFVITDEDSDNLIAVGGVRTLAEAVLLTNKDYHVRDRRRAFFSILDANCYFAQKTNHDSLHAFVQDHTWEYYLRRKWGFQECKGKPLFIPVGDK